MSILKRKSPIVLPSFDGCDPAIKEEIFSYISRGNMRINYYAVKRFCDSAFSADIICRTLTSQLGMEIEFEGKTYKSWNF